MCAEHPKDNKECNDDHNQHLCYFVSFGYHVDDAEKYNALIKDPQYKCYICGRVAHSEKSLCKPVKL